MRVLGTVAALVMLIGCSTASTGRVQRVEGSGCDRIVVIYETARDKTETVSPVPMVH